MHSGLNHHRRSSGHHRKSRKGGRTGSALVYLSSVLRFLIFAFVLVDLVLLATMSISEAADPVEIYVRNISSIAALIVLASFFNYYYFYHTADINQYYMRSLKIASFFLFIAGIVKVIISGYYFAFCLANGNFVMFFYVGEILVWSMISLFAFYYYKRLRKN